MKALPSILFAALLASSCASATCEQNGSCADATAPDTQEGDTSTDVADVPADSAETSSDATPDTPDTASNTCIPNHDNTITRQEIPLAVGLYSTFLVSAEGNLDFDTAGTPDPESDNPIWDLTPNFPGDHRVILELQPLTDRWFASDFPNATYVSRLSDTKDLLGVFQITDDALLLLGVASPEDSFSATNVAYDPPVTVLQFPLTVGASWSTASTVTGNLQGFFSTYSEDYTYTVDTPGTLITPFTTFPVLRITSELTRTVGFVPTTTQTHLYITECFGTVATVVSEPGETGAEFTTASEIRRIAP